MVTSLASYSFSFHCEKRSTIGNVDEVRDRWARLRKAYAEGRLPKHEPKKRARPEKTLTPELSGLGNSVRSARSFVEATPEQNCELFVFARGANGCWGSAGSTRSTPTG